MNSSSVNLSLSKTELQLSGFQVDLLSLKDVYQLELLLEPLQQLVTLLLELLVLLQQPLVDFAAVPLLFGLNKLVRLELQLRLFEFFGQLVYPASCSATAALSSRALFRTSSGSSTSGSVLFPLPVFVSRDPRSSASFPCWRS